MNAVAALEDEQWDKVSADKLVSQAAALTRAIAYKKGIDLKAKNDEEIALEANQNLLYDTLKRENQNGGLIFQPSLQAETPSTLYAQPINYIKNGAWDNTTARLVGGDWNQAVYSIRQDMTYKVLDQAVISDGSGRIIYNLAQQDMVALRCVMRLGWQLPNPVTAIGGADRYPFAVLTPQTVTPSGGDG